MQINKPTAIGLAVVAILIATFVMWKTLFADPYAVPPPIVTGGGAASVSTPDKTPALTLPSSEGPTASKGMPAGGLNMPTDAPGQAGSTGATAPPPGN